MIANLISYPKMKPSGVEWLGDVPEHWEVRRLGQIGRLSKGNGGNKEDEVSLGVPCVRYGDLYTTHTHFILKSRSFVSMAKAEDYTPITFGDVLFAASGETINEIGKSAVNLMQSEACCGGDVILFRSERQVEARYMGYATDCRPAAAQKATMGRGITVKHVYGDQLKYLTLALPPLPEQAAIVRYLDHADRRIRRYIHAKQKLVKLLEEQKQALIHQIVTRGLDPNVRLKPSGVEWLGDVPEHWAVRKLKHLTCFHNGLAFKPSDWSADGVPIIRIQNLNGSDDFNYTVRKDLPDFLLIRPGDLLFSWSGNRGTSFGSYIWNRDFVGYLNQHIFKLDGYPLDRGYFSHLLRAVTRHVEEQTHGIIGLVHVTKPELGRVLIPVAPPKEQRKIAQAIDERLARVHAAIDRARRQIELLQEYSTRLIADVVTGKLDVREAAASLLEEADERDPLDEVVPLADDVVDNLYHRVGRGAGNGK